MKHYVDIMDSFVSSFDDRYKIILKNDARKEYVRVYLFLRRTSFLNIVNDMFVDKQ